MKKCFLVQGISATVALFMLGQTLHADVLVAQICRYSPDEGWSNTRGANTDTIIHANPVDLHMDHPSGIPEIIRRIIQLLRINPDFNIYLVKGTDNAMAFMEENEHRGLLFDVAFLQNLNERTGTEWSAIQVIAHEVGHHVAGFSDDLYRSELNADYWSGQILQRLGASKKATLSALHSIINAEATPTHPAMKERVASAITGWEHAAKGEIDFSFCDDC